MMIYFYLAGVLLNSSILYMLATEVKEKPKTKAEIVAFVISYQIISLMSWLSVLFWVVGGIYRSFKDKKND